MASGSTNQVLVGNARPVREWVLSSSLSRLAALVAYRYGLQKQDAEDLAQDVSLALLRLGPDFLVNVTFIVHTSAHKAADIVRHRSLAGPVWSSETDPTGNAELTHLLRARLSELPQRLRDFCQLRYEEGLSHREISEKLGLCRGSVRWMEERCLRILSEGAKP